MKFKKKLKNFEIILWRLFRNVSVKHLTKFWGNFETIFLKFPKNCMETIKIIKIYCKNLRNTSIKFLKYFGAI